MCSEVFAEGVEGQESCVSGAVMGVQPGRRIGGCEYLYRVLALGAVFIMEV